MILYIDANIILNVWRQEKDPKTGKELWKGSGDVLERIELGEDQGIIGITTVMEVLHAVRVGAIEKDLDWHKEVDKAIDKLSRKCRCICIEGWEIEEKNSGINSC